MSNDVAKALARLSSGLYIVTAAHRGGARGAMVASWVAQVNLQPSFHAITTPCPFVWYLMTALRVGGLP